MAWKRRKELLEELAMVLVKVKAIQFGTFTLASGRISSYYIDLRTIPSYPGAYRTLVEAYGEYLKHEFKESSYDAIAGIPTAGLTLSSPVALQLEKPMIYVRKDEKDHGRGKLVEGVTRPGWKVLVVDDVITTGGSILSAVEAIRAEGCEVETASVVIDRLEGGATAMKKNDVRLHAMTDIIELVKILRGEALLSTDEANAVTTQVHRR
ncbi:MAG: orotate phosphoribosyltransferase [Nitrososphaerota archaeon]|nr:orotate phosphoribosyltransferase [Nitrososphaerota archaeon]MDG6967252.1 orotate phosphoribosyltransferase [Nitrososphaerota archaeon]MDG6977897.1 orotate phosphoribosyltransferase [Nitrososphaerota archaeon]MDG7006491.1 orotate phosphoribosyltransferase [Nitrososphaerota archaeon]MDG7022142.1 orotate phosphoribosyltransferase [Nitrososphaerota archaeon]